MNINIAILEDNENDYTLLMRHLNDWSSTSGNIIHISWFSSEEHIYEDFSNTQFDILFSDIELKTCLHTSGIEICGKLRKSGYTGEIIFLTAYSEFVFEGYNVNAFNYLLKPIKSKKLLSCMSRYMALHMSDYYYYRKGNDIIQIPYDKIIYFFKNGHDVTVQLMQDFYSERTTLNEIEKHLPSMFQRCHKSCIINMLHVHSLSGNTVYLSNNTTQTVGRNYLPLIRKALVELAQC